MRNAILALASLAIALQLSCANQNREAFDDSLIRKFEESDEASSRALIASAMGNWGPSARKCIPTLKRAIKDDNPIVKVEAANSLIRIDGGELPTALPALMQALESTGSEETLSRGKAIHYLGALERKAQAALPKLSELMDKNDSEYEKVIAAAAIARIDSTGKNRSVDVLRDGLLRGKFQGTKYAAAEGLGQIGGRARDALPDLQKALDCDDEFLKQTFRTAIDRINNSVKK